MISPVAAPTFIALEHDGVPGTAPRHPGEPFLECWCASSAAVLRASGGHVAVSPTGRVVGGFETPDAAVLAILGLRTALGATAGAEAIGELRLAAHAGAGWLGPAGQFTGPAVRTVARLVDAARAGQILLSSAVGPGVAGYLPDGWSVVDLGVQRLRDLSPPTRVFELTEDGVATSAPLGSWLDIPNNLPLQPTSLVGRKRELAELGALLPAHRLLTMTGVGGSGKSRLAGQAAADVRDRWPDGAWWIDLAETRESAEVSVATATALGVLLDPGLGPLRSVISQLRDRRMIVILDNCEQVLAGAGQLAEGLLLECPDVTVVATSREPLGVRGETVWHVPPLDADDALALFVERATVTRPRLTLDASSERVVRAICSALDGMPLALELAATWLRTMTPDQILAELDERLALLVTGPRSAAPRQRTLAASIDWSHRLLDETDQVVFRRLATFRGTFNLSAARAVCGGPGMPPAKVTGSLARLVDKSLVTVEDGVGERRYRLLETIRQYAADRLAEAGEVAACRDRHLGYFLELAEDGPEPGPAMHTWRARVERETDNLRAALDRGLDLPDPQQGRRLAAALAWSWHFSRNGYEGIEYLRRAIARTPDERSPLQARLLTGVALVADTASPLDLELDAAQQALSIATEVGDDRLRALSLTLAAVGQFYTDFAVASDLASEAETLGKRIGDEFVVHASRALRGMILHLADRQTEAEPLLASAVDGLVRRHRGIAATTLAFQAQGLASTGDLDGARATAERAVAMAESLGDHLRFGSSRSVLALIRGMAGDVPGAFLVMEPVLRLDAALEGDVFVPELGYAMGWLHLLRGEPAPAKAWFERDTGAPESSADTWLAARSLPGLAASLLALGRIDDARDAVRRAQVVATQLGMPGVLADALEQEARIDVAVADLDSALTLHHDALAIRESHGLRTASLDSLDSLAVLAARAGRAEEAVRVLAASSAARRDIGYPRNPVAQARLDATVAAVSASIGQPAVAAASAAGAQLALDDAVAYVRRARGTRGRPVTGWASLTATELEVVHLVVAGRTNPEIGARLFMSRGTVKTHLSHVYAKLDVANRTELATLAAVHRDRA